MALRAVASVLLIYAGFALFQAVADGQPLASVARGRGLRTAARLLAAAAVGGASALLAPALGTGAALLFSAAALVLVATVFVLLAPIRPWLAWGAAVVAPFLSAILLLASQEMP